MLAHYNILLDQARGIWGDDSDNSVARPQISLFKLYSPRPKKIPENSIGSISDSTLYYDNTSLFDLWSSFLPPRISVPQLLSTMLPPEMTIAAEERSREGQAENESIADPQALAAHNASMDAVGLVIESKLAELGFSGRANRPIWAGRIL